jgi:truncated hemoglobin YjbI
MNMHKHRLTILSLTASLGWLTACPGEVVPQDTDTDTDTSTGTTEDPTNDPSNTPTTNTPTSNPPTTEGPTEPTTGGPTTEPDTSTGPDPTETETGGDGELCAHLGGEAGIGALVTNFLGKVLVDDRINGYFLNSDVDGAALGVCVAQQLGEAAGCAGVTYTCDDMKSAHAGLKISQQDFDDFAEDFVAAITDHKADAPDLTDDDITQIVDLLAGMAGDIVEDPEGDDTVYQRVGRKPAIATLIGHPGEAGSFVDNVAMNPEINGFFTNTDFDRLNTCLTRQVAGIDGPVKYGLEVDPPAADVDPGVALDNPCKDMESSHEGLQDADMNPITIDDFLALVTDLVNAMNTAGVAPGDQDAILAVLGPMCEMIVADANTCPGNFTTETVEVMDLALDLVPHDDKYNGTIESMACTELEVLDDGINFVDDMRLKVGMDHTWVGDITIKIVSPEDKLLTVLGRPGNEAMPLADNGMSCCGDNSNLSVQFPFTLSDAATIGGKDMGKAPLGDNQIICKDENPKLAACEFRPYPGGGPGVAFADYHGVSAVGVWQVCIGDSGQGDTGNVQYLGLTFDKVKFGP